jgi:hypothetical protein
LVPERPRELKQHEDLQLGDDYHSDNPDVDPLLEPDPPATASSASALLSRTLLTVISHKRGAQTAILASCKAFKSFIPAVVQGPREEEGKLEVPTTMSQLEAFAKLDQTEAGLTVTQYCSCVGGVFDDVILVLDQCPDPSCRKPRPRLRQGGNDVFLLASVVKKIQRLWAQPHTAKLLHYASDRTDQTKNGDCFEGTDMCDLTPDHLRSTGYITWSADAAELQRSVKKSYSPVCGQV